MNPARLCCLALALQPPAQDRAAQNPASLPAEHLAKFDALPTLRQAMLVRRIEQRIAESGDPAAKRIAGLHADSSKLPPAPPPQHFTPEEWTPGLAPTRFVIPSADPRHQAVRRAMPRILVLPDLERGVSFAWGKGVLVKNAALSWRQRFTNLLHGFAPSSDEAFARVLAALDHDKAQRPLAEYFEHTYADRQAGVYEGVTLYEAWYAGDVMEMPDVDAMAFAVRLLGDRELTAPIPQGPIAEALYEKMKQSALAYRKYRTMLEAAAAAFVCAEPVMDPMYAQLAPRFHYLFATHGDDLGRVREVLAKANGRDAFIKLVDDAVVRDQKAMQRREGRKKEMLAMVKRVREITLATLAEEKAPSPTPSEAKEDREGPGASGKHTP